MFSSIAHSSSREQQRKAMLDTYLRLLLEYSRTKENGHKSLTWSVTKAATRGSGTLDEYRHCDILYGDELQSFDIETFERVDRKKLYLVFGTKNVCTMNHKSTLRLDKGVVVCHDAVVTARCLCGVSMLSIHRF